MKDIDIALWPIAIVQDRYMGTYTGGDWVAIPRADLAGDFDETVWGDDMECMSWAEDNKKIVGIGSTPDAALDNLYLKALTMFSDG